MSNLQAVDEHYQESLTIDELLEALLGVKDELKVLSKQEQLLKEQQRNLEQTIIEQMQSQGLKRGGNDHCIARIDIKEVPQVTDWQQVYEYVLETGHTQLFQKRLATKAWEEINDVEAEPVPGIELFQVTKLSVNRSSK